MSLMTELRALAGPLPANPSPAGEISAGRSHADSGYIACNHAGEPYTPGALTNMWHRLTTAAGVPRSGTFSARPKRFELPTF